MTFQQATRELRAALRLSQQAMASYLGLSLAALRNYESGIVKHPDARAAYAYMKIAGRPEAVRVFELALCRALGIPEDYEVLIRRRNPAGQEALDQWRQPLKRGEG